MSDVSRGIANGENKYHQWKWWCEGRPKKGASFWEKTWLRVLARVFARQWALRRGDTQKRVHTYTLQAHTYVYVKDVRVQRLHLWIPYPCESSLVQLAWWQIPWLKYSWKYKELLGSLEYTFGNTWIKTTTEMYSTRVLVEVFMKIQRHYCDHWNILLEV